MFKRRLSIIMAVAMLTASMPSFAFGAEKDYLNHWAKDTIMEWYDNGLIKGYDDGSFKPENSISRAEFMTMINKSYEFTAKDEINFDDVAESEWYYAEVQKAVQAGYIIGDGNNTIRPEDEISREEVAVIVSRLNGLSQDADNAKTFADKDKISNWAIGYVGAAANAGFMIGNDKGEFCPSNKITRAESLVTIDRAANDKTEEDLPNEDIPAEDNINEENPAQDNNNVENPAQDNNNEENPAQDNNNVDNPVQDTNDKDDSVVDNSNSNEENITDEEESTEDEFINFAKLDDILLEGASLEQAFNPETTTYSAVASSADSITLKAITYRESTITAYVDGVKCAQINFENYNGGAAYKIDVPLNPSGTTVVTLTYSEPNLEDGLYTITINNQ
ncbi:MAG: S-layer homology domain-containing protein [Sedimentibacter sp.]